MAEMSNKPRAAVAAERTLSCPAAAGEHDLLEGGGRPGCTVSRGQLCVSVPHGTFWASQEASATCAAQPGELHPQIALAAQSPARKK